MYSKFIVLALCAASVSGAQVRTKAIELANKAANTVNERTEALATVGSDQQKPATGTKTVIDSAKGGAVVATMTSPTDLASMTREVFQYDGGGRRDPFTSLTRTGALRPHISELSLVVAIVATNGSKSVATVRDNTTKEMYAIKVGDSLGRYRVVRIDRGKVTFAIEEFGFSRQETLAMGDTTKVRN
jgi:hypothetical protein